MRVNLYVFTYMPSALCTFPDSCSKTKFSGWDNAAIGWTFGIFAAEDTGLCKSSSSCQHVLLSCIQYWKQFHPGSTVPLSLQCDFSTDFYVSATTLFPILKTAPSKLIPVSVWSPLL